MPFNYFKLLLLWMAVSLSAACESGASGSHNNASDAFSLTQDHAFASPQEALQRSMELRHLGENEKALALLAAAHRTYPEDSAILSAYARLALTMGRHDIAAQILPDAIAADGKDWRVLSAQGVLYGRTGKLPEALDMFTQAQGVSSGDAMVLNNLAVGQLLAGQSEKAIQLLRQALAAAAAEPGRAHVDRIRGNLALSLAVAGQFQEADRLAGETLPRTLLNADPASLRRLMGGPATHLAQTSALPPARAGEAPPFDPFSR